MAGKCCAFKEARRLIRVGQGRRDKKDVAKVQQAKAEEGDGLPLGPAELQSDVLCRQMEGPKLSCGRTICV